MKTRLAYSLSIAIAGLCACSDKIANRIEGQWQLKTIESNGIISQVDTVFYNFMGGRVFAYIALVNPSEGASCFGYVDELSDQQILINIDLGGDSLHFHHIRALSEGDWDATRRIFDIQDIDGKYLTLHSHDNNKTYSFKKH
ncbi:MAG: lipocalin-like domain-containing protein [Dysgonamonadaceae bacterium]|jgi:hypothetical protein|nr:lipocalin-like domain-containing protein [Dysgonamonadaceae bacterium]